MEREEEEEEPNLLPQPVSSSTTTDLHRSFTSTASSSSSSFSSSSQRVLLRQVQAAFKRHRPLGTKPITVIRPRRSVVRHREVSKSSVSDVDVGMKSKATETDEQASTIVDENQEGPSVTPLSSTGTMTNTYDNGFSVHNAKEDLHRLVAGSKKNDEHSNVTLESQDVPLVDCVRKVKFSLGNTSRPHGAVTAISHNLKHQNLTNQDKDSKVNSLLLAKGTTELQDELYQFRDLLPVDLSHPQSSIIGLSSATTTFNSTSAPLLKSTTAHPCSQVNIGPSADTESNKECITTSEPICQGKSRMTVDLMNEAQYVNSRAGQMEAKEYEMGKQQKCRMLKKSDISKNPSPDNKLNRLHELDDGIHSQDVLPKRSTSDLLIESSKSEKQDKGPSSKAAAGSHKKGYAPDLDFKVNGKLYQRLGKIGSGGSSEVYKVISTDCTIYALKKIKLKGRDYATAYGFCQEIEYLNKLKGKNNIIQLIDYEVTDKALFHEVVSGSMNKDGRVKKDSYIYMVLEYGEIDLAKMLSLKWREIDGTNSTIDENWLRFYWQQILQAVNTIHEERIVHSDLKPANFLLVKGSLKLIDFGIAKAIMSDTTNIQRDSQMGTLSYMSPEAYMCNETDAKGNIIKCGRPSDIWSLGCILYQMVYGRTPFSESKTFWAKFKVITDPNHKIKYESVSNPWLLDIMKTCLAWDRNDRWRIPQILKHPFLVPPSHNNNTKLLQSISESCGNNPRVVSLSCQLRELLNDPVFVVMSPSLSMLKDEYRLLLGKMSSICIQLQEQI
ncbi:serine/threonine-protein kinase MPS1-like [Impatiens glandulifera]|uniref:serine/threonine-protein kinase MPS1-like n=1 Tax=Impatiens glandulifera TaxID=253017 RepID=UPI001FB11E51|nr:serine/threonine-protein kinase MPS1-like [Impatiens glandulifera]